MRTRLFAAIAAGCVAGWGCDALFGTRDGADRVLWRVPFVTRGSHTQPLVLDSVVVFATRSGWVVALDRSRGRLRWKTQVLPDSVPILARNLASTPTDVLVPAIRVVALDLRTGRERWAFDAPPDAPGDESIAVADTLGFASGTLGLVYAFDTRTGAERWRADLGERPFGLVASRGSLYFGTRGILTGGLGAGHLIALDAGTGSERWRVPAPDGPGRPSSGGSLGFPTVTATTAFFTGMAGRVYALSAAAGDSLWVSGEWAGPGDPYDTGPVLAGETLVTVRDDGRVFGWSSETGTQRWSVRIGGPVDQPVTDGRRVFTNTSRVYAITADGSVAWVFPPTVSAFGFSASPAVADGILYLVADDGFYALRAGP
jgi:outer membrane protein assembly factor BamB